MTTEEGTPDVEAADRDSWAATDNSWMDGVAPPVNTPDAVADVPVERGQAEDSDDSDAEFSPEDRQLIELLAAGRTQEEAGREAGCSERTVRRRKSNPTFAARVAAARAERIEVAASRLTNLSARAVAVLDDALNDGNPRVRLRAVEMVFGLGAAARQATDVESRISVLEAALEEAAP